MYTWLLSASIKAGAAVRTLPMLVATKQRVANAPYQDTSQRVRAYLYQSADASATSKHADSLRLRYTIVIEEEALWLTPRSNYFVNGVTKSLVGLVHQHHSLQVVGLGEHRAQSSYIAYTIATSSRQPSIGLLVTRTQRVSTRHRAHSYPG